MYTSVPTPYYREVVMELPLEESVPEPTQNFDSYNIFCLKTRLTPYLLPNERVNVVGDLLEGKMVMVIKIYINNDLQLLDESRFDELEKAIGTITTEDQDFCLINPCYISTGGWDDLDIESREIVPAWYVHMMAVHVFVPAPFKHYLIDGYFMVYMNPETVDFGVVYDNLSEKINEEFVSMWTRGYISCPKDFAKKWELVSEGYDDVYHADWSLMDLGFPELRYITPFLYDALMGNPFTLKVRNTDMVDNIKKAGYHMMGAWIYIPCDNITRFKQDISIISEIDPL